MTDKEKLRKAIKALRLADSIMEYCAGDAWEREATAKDRVKFQKLFAEVVGESSQA